MDAASGWEPQLDPESGEITSYYNHHTGEESWEQPGDYSAPEYTGHEEHEAWNELPVKGGGDSAWPSRDYDGHQEASLWDVEDPSAAAWPADGGAEAEEHEWGGSAVGSGGGNEEAWAQEIGDVHSSIEDSAVGEGYYDENGHWIDSGHGGAGDASGYWDEAGQWVDTSNDEHEGDLTHSVMAMANGNVVDNEASILAIPSEWEEHFDEDSQAPYWYNTITFENVYEKPQALVAYEEQQEQLQRGDTQIAVADGNDDENNNDGSHSGEEGILALVAGASNENPQEANEDGEKDGEKDEEEEAWTVVPHAKWLVRRRWRKAFLFVLRARYADVLARYAEHPAALQAEPHGNKSRASSQQQQQQPKTASSQQQQQQPKTASSQQQQQPKTASSQQQQQPKTDTSPGKAPSKAPGKAPAKGGGAVHGSSTGNNDTGTSDPVLAEATSSLSSSAPRVSAVLKAEARLGTLALMEGEYDDACQWLDQACARMRSSPYSPLIAAGLGAGGTAAALAGVRGGTGGLTKGGGAKGGGGSGSLGVGEEHLSSEDFESIDMTMLLRRSGQAHLKRFDEDGLHRHLVSAKERLMDALLLAEPGLLNYGLVPSMLMELACLYERFGAFEGALELMGKVTEFFPDFGKYGEVLHRAAVVMAHLSTLPNAPIPELMDRCVDFLDELFVEKLAPPQAPGGQEAKTDGEGLGKVFPPPKRAQAGKHPLASRSDVLLLYGRCCLTQGNPLNAEKGAAALELALQVRQATFSKGSLDLGYDPCLRSNITSWNNWLEDPDSLLVLAREFNDGGEPTLAVFHYERHLEARTAQRKHRPNSSSMSSSLPGDNLLTTLRGGGGGEGGAGSTSAAASLFGSTTSMMTSGGGGGSSKLAQDTSDFLIYLEMAHTYASFQDLEAAKVYALKAYELREHDTTVRTLLSAWSPKHAQLFRDEAAAQVAVHHHWRGRVRDRARLETLLNMQIAAWEAALAVDPWNVFLRAKLAYFARKRWRPLFLFQTSTASRLQRWIRQRLSLRGYHAALRAQHMKTLASTLQALRRKPYALDTRANCLKLAGHKRTPKSHKITRCEASFNEQEVAVCKLQRQYRRLLARRYVELLRQNRVALEAAHLTAAAVKVQSRYRANKAKAAAAKFKEVREQEVKAASFLQGLWRRKMSAWRITEQALEEVRRRKALQRAKLAAKRLQAWWRSVAVRLVVRWQWPTAAVTLQRILGRGCVARWLVWRLWDGHARRLQRVWRAHVDRQRWQALLARLLAAKRAPPAPLSATLMKRFVERGRWKASVSDLINTRNKQDMAGGGFDYAEDDDNEDGVINENFFVANGGDGDDASTGGGTVGSAYGGSNGSSGGVVLSAIGGCSDGGSSEHAGDVWPLELRGRQPTQLLPWRPKRVSRSRNADFADGSSVGIADGTGNDGDLSPFSGSAALAAASPATITTTTIGSDAYAQPLRPPGVRWLLAPFLPPGLPGSPAWPRAVAAESLVFVAPTYRPSLGLPNTINSNSSSSNASSSSSTSNLGALSAASSSSLIGQSQSQSRRDRDDNATHPPPSHPQQAAGTSSGDFSAVDLFTTSALLRHPECGMHTLALLGADLSSPDGSLQLATALSTNTSLRRMVLGGCKLPPSSLLALASSLKAHNFTLRELHLDANPLAGEMMADGEPPPMGVLGHAFGALLAADFFSSQYGRLEVLSLCKLNLDDDDARAIAQGLSSSVSRNQAGAGAGGWTLKQAQQKPKHHKRGRGTTATASNTNGDAQDNSNKNNSCKMHPTGQLRRLLLSENAIGDEGCAAIVAALRDRDQATLDALRVRQSKTSASSSGNGQNTQDLKIPFGSPQKVEEDKDGDGKESNKEDDEWLPEGLWELDLSHNRITETGAAQLLTYLKSANGSCLQDHHHHHHHHHSHSHDHNRHHHTRALATANGSCLQDHHHHHHHHSHSHDHNRHHHTRALATSSTSSASRREAWPSGQNKDNMSNHHENNISNSNVSDSVDHLLDSFLGPLGPPTSCTGSSLVRLELKGNLVNDSVARAASHLMRDFPYLELDIWEGNLFRAQPLSVCESAATRAAATMVHRRSAARQQRRQQQLLRKCQAAGLEPSSSAGLGLGPPSPSSSVAAAAVVATSGGGRGHGGTTVAGAGGSSPAGGSNASVGLSSASVNTLSTQGASATPAALAEVRAQKSLASAAKLVASEAHDSAAALSANRLMQGYRPHKGVPDDLFGLDIFRGRYALLDLEASARTAAADASSVQHHATTQHHHQDGGGGHNGGSGEGQGGSSVVNNNDDAAGRRPTFRDGAARMWRQFPLPTAGQYTDEARTALARKLNAMHAHSMPPHHQQQQNHHSAENQTATGGGRGTMAMTGAGAATPSVTGGNSRRVTPVGARSSGSSSGVTADVLRTRFGLPTVGSSSNAAGASSHGKKPARSRRLSSQSSSIDADLFARSDGALSAAHAAAAAFAAKEWGGSGNHKHINNIHSSSSSSSSTTFDGNGGNSVGGDIWSGPPGVDSTSDVGEGSLSPFSHTSERTLARHGVTDPLASSLFLAAATVGSGESSLLPHMSSVVSGSSRSSTGMQSSNFNSSSSSANKRLSRRRHVGEGGLGAGNSSAEKGRALLHGALVSPDNPFADPFADLDTPRLYNNIRSNGSSGGLGLGLGMAQSAARPGRSQTKGGLGLSGAL